MGELQFGLLGPLAVWSGTGEPVPVPERKVRALLADLLLHPGQLVPVAQLIDDLWAAAPPGDPANTLQTKVSQLRRALAAASAGATEGLLVHQGGGYLLRVEPEQVDTGRFARLCRQARASRDPRARAEQFGAALALWRGPVLAEVAGERFAQPAIAHWEEQRLLAIEEQAEARLRLGDHAGLAGELGDWVARHPLRERLRATHIRALYGAGRHREALESFRELRERLADELGLDPGPELTALHTAVLRHDPSLRPSAAGPPEPVPGNLPTELGNLPTELGNLPTELGNLPAPPGKLPTELGNLPAPPGNLPVMRTELVGRGDLLAELSRQLTAHRLVTLVGPAGVGKTRLALAAAAGTHPPDGVWLVELGGLPPAGSGDAVAGLADLLAAVLGIRDDATGSPGRGTAGELVDRLARAVAGRRMLLLLDNCEHVIEPAAGLLNRLLAGAPQLRVLATSREPLALAGEVVCAVPPLDLPAAGETDPVRVGTAGAAALFIACAAAAAPGFRLHAGNAAAVGTVCRRLDGIPLALELAASQVRAFGVAELAELLDDRFRLLSTGKRAAPPRHRTLRATIDWSWRLLSEPERAVLRRLAVVAEGTTLAAARVLCAGGEVADAAVPALLSRLVDKSLVVADPDAGGTGSVSRYRLLESVAAYALEQWDAAGERAAVRDRHRDYYLALAEAAEPQLRGRDARGWLQRLDAESANLRAALAHAIDSGATEPALRLARALSWYWFLRGRLREAVQWLARARALPGAAPPTVVARAGGAHAGLTLLLGTGRTESDEDALARFTGTGDRAGLARAQWLLGFAEFARGDLATSEELVTRAENTFTEWEDAWGAAACATLRANQAIFRNDLAVLRECGERGAAGFAELGDDWGRLQALEALGVLAELTGDYAGGARIYQEGLRIAEALQLWGEVAAMRSRLGRIALLTGDYPRADQWHERARSLAASHGNIAGEEFAALGLALSARRRGRLDAAEELLRHWLEWNWQLEAQYGVALILAELGFVAEQRGDAGAAEKLHREGLAAARGTGDVRAVALALEGLAGAAALAGRAVEAARLLGAADAARRSVGAPLPAGERGDVDRITTRATAALGPEGFAAGFAHGTGLLPDQVAA